MELRQHRPVDRSQMCEVLRYLDGAHLHIAEGGVTASIVLLDRLKTFCPVGDELCADIFGDPESNFY